MPTIRELIKVSPTLPGAKAPGDTVQFLMPQMIGEAVDSDSFLLHLDVTLPTAGTTLEMLYLGALALIDKIELKVGNDILWSDDHPFEWALLERLGKTGPDSDRYNKLIRGLAITPGDSAVHGANKVTNGGTVHFAIPFDQFEPFKHELNFSQFGAPVYLEITLAPTLHAFRDSGGASLSDYSVTKMQLLGDVYRGDALANVKSGALHLLDHDYQWVPLSDSTEQHITINSKKSNVEAYLVYFRADNAHAPTVASTWEAPVDLVPPKTTTLNEAWIEIGGREYPAKHFTFDTGASTMAGTDDELRLLNEVRHYYGDRAKHDGVFKDQVVRTRHVLEKYYSTGSSLISGVDLPEGSFVMVFDMRAVRDDDAIIGVNTQTYANNVLHLKFDNGSTAAGYQVEIFSVYNTFASYNSDTGAITISE